MFRRAAAVRVPARHAADATPPAPVDESARIAADARRVLAEQTRRGDTDAVWLGWTLFGMHPLDGAS